MKLISLFIFTLIFSSCVKHQQEGSVKGRPEGQTVKLTGPDVLFEKVGSYDYSGMQLELESGLYDVNAQNARGELILNEAIKQERDLLVILLIKFGAEPNLADAQNQSAFDLVSGFADKVAWENILNGDTVEQDFLNNKLLDILNRSATDTQSETIRLIEIYLANGASINSADRRGFPLLITAATKNLPSVVEFIASHEGVLFTHKSRGTDVPIIKTLQRGVRRNPHLKQMIALIKSYMDA